jgi:hypothetical protein
LWFPPLQATEPLDCESRSYLVRIVLGSGDYVGNVMLYDKKKTYAPNEVPTIAVDRPQVRWKKRVFLKSPAGAPRFVVDVKGKSGWLNYRDQRERLTCNWFE